MKIIQLQLQIQNSRILSIISLKILIFLEKNFYKINYIRKIKNKRIKSDNYNLNTLSENNIMENPKKTDDTISIYGNTNEKIAIYTVITNNYDYLKQPEIIESGFDYICFTDTEIKYPGVWQIRKIDYFNSDPTRVARFIKTHPHIYLPDYDKSLWIDGNLSIRNTLYNLAFEYLELAPFYAFIHPDRECVYDEGVKLIERGGLDNKTIILNHMARLREAGYPEKNGLTDTSVLFRRHHESKALNEAWWREMMTGSKCDQLSLNYVAWKLGIEIYPLAPFGTSARNSEYFERSVHLKDLSQIKTNTEANDQLTLNGRKQLADPHPHLRTVELADQNASTQTVDIVICIHNDPKQVKLCLDAVRKHRSPQQRLILVDDGSTEETRLLVDDHTSHCSDDLIIRHERTQGYTKAANAGIKASTADYVILLDSSTIVPENWVSDLVTNAERLDEIGIIGPLSNAACWQSVPITLTREGEFAVNDLPASRTVSQTSELCKNISAGRPVLVPFVDRFCFAIKRTVIDAIGFLDEDNFPMGSGEDNDFCLRAGDAGFLCAIATDCYVFHAKPGKSTNDHRKALSKSGNEAMQAKYTKSRVDNAVLSTRTHPGTRCYA